MHVSERRACAALGQHRSTQRRTPRGREDEERLTADVPAIAREFLKPAETYTASTGRIQDIGAQSIVPLLDLQKGQTFLDLNSVSPAVKKLIRPSSR